VITDCVPLHIGKHMNDDEALVSLNVYGRDGIPVCRMGGNVSATEPTLMSKHEEFAQLFSAAPDLLEACKAMLEEYGGTDRVCGDMAQAAIAKAEGRS
jgi:hypothetical protein